MSWLLLLFCSFAFAETLEPIEVRAEKDISRFTFTGSETISTHDLETEPLGIVSPSLEKIPGVIANQNGGPGGRVSFFIRGTESRHVSFVLDGLKINDTSNTDRQFDAAFMTSPFVDSMKVYKGPQAVLYGSDAIGGMIEMTSRKGGNAPETRFNLNTGSFGTIGSSLAQDWTKNSSQGTVTVTRFHTDGISRLNEKRYDASERDASDITQITSSSRHEIGNKVRTDLLVSFLRGKAEQDGFNTDNNHDFSKNDQYILQQKTELNVGSDQVVSLRNGFNRHQRLNDSLSAGKEFFNGNLIQNEALYRKEGDQFGLLAGVSHENESSKARTLDRSFDLASAFLQTSWEKDFFKVHGGVRADHHSRYGSFYTGSAGVGIYDFSFQYSRGYKAPSLYQLFGPDSFGAPVGNPDLVPETNHYLEASWEKKTNHFESKIALFQNRLSNLFTYSFTEGYLNQQDFIAEGVEVSGKVMTSSFHYFGSVTHQNFRNEETTVLRRPRNTAQLGVSYFIQETLELNFLGRWYSSRKDFGSTGVVKLNGFEVFDLGLRKSWERDDVSLQIKNLLNREYEELYGFSVLPRSVFLNYGHRF